MRQALYRLAKRLQPALMLLPILVGGLFVSLPSQAVVEVTVTEGVEGALAIAVVPFGWEGKGPLAPEDVAQIVESDLKRSGQFAPLGVKEMISMPSEASKVNFGDWRKLNVDHLVIGKVKQQPTGEYAVQFQLFDVLRNKQLIGYSIPAAKRDLRKVAHQISDLIYEKLLSKPGAFQTRIAYVTASGPVDKRRYELLVADSDGHNDQSVLESRQPIMSPSWSPDASQLAYVSFEKGGGHVYVQSIASGRRAVVAAHDGINGAPTWSPDGKHLALTLSKDGNPEIYLLDLRSKRLQRLTNHLAIDTEPAFSPDGRDIYFTSDRGGRPQIYKVSVNGGSAQRVTFEGKYNARASISADGEFMAMVHGDGNGFRIGLLELKTGALRMISDGKLDESPSFSPNGVMVLYATQERGQAQLSAVSVDKRVRQSLRVSSADVREPAWSPYISR